MVYAERANLSASPHNLQIFWQLNLIALRGCKRHDACSYTGRRQESRKTEERIMMKMNKKVGAAVLSFALLFAIAAPTGAIAHEKSSKKSKIKYIGGGAVVGAVVGGLVGGKKGALIGAGIGAGAGYIYSKNKDKDRRFRNSDRRDRDRWERSSRRFDRDHRDYDDDYDEDDDDDDDDDDKDCRRDKRRRH
jgi:osmotically inducible lipoprotein OsmB